MNYEAMKVFYITAIEKNFSKAANRLFTSQPAISRTIANIEAQVGFKLFERLKSGVKLTREGQNLFDLIEAPFNQLERINDGLENNDFILNKSIHIGATITALNSYLFNLIDLLQNEIPSLKYHIVSGSSSQLLNLLRQGEVDFIFITTPFQEDNDLNIINIKPINSILVAGMEYYPELNKKKNIKDLTQYPFILLSKHTQFREHVDIFFKANKININPKYEVDNVGLLIPMVEKNYGLSFLPEEMAELSIARNKAFIVPLIEELPERYLTYVEVKNRTYSNIIEVIKNLIKLNISKNDKTP